MFELFFVDVVVNGIACRVHEVVAAMAQEATAIGIAHFAAVAAFGKSLEELAGNWKAESIYTPQMKSEERVKKLSQWRKALEAVKAYYS